MIRRFSLYGFLKNQRYFEPFIILFFLQQGLSFTQIGFLVAFRELFINLMEIPSGAVADLFGRRRSMVLSFISYIISFAVFGFSHDYWHFFIAMFFFASGEAFRTGTHKAMIFTWLRLQGRIAEKTRVYGYTRSWSKIGSAVSTVLAVVFILVTDDYTYVFFFAIVPYIIGLANFMTYPKELEGQPEKGAGMRDITMHLWECIHDTLAISRLRHLILESMSFGGVYKAVEGYLQPVIMNMALTIPLFVAWSDTRRSAIMIGGVYVVLYLISAYASRYSYRITDRAGGEEEGSRFLWKTVFVLYVSLIPLLYFGYYYLAVTGFVLLALIQNLWQPVQVSRFEAFACETKGATILSVNSQATAVATMIVAPVLGAAVDLVRGQDIGKDFWPVAVIAASITFIILLLPRQGENTPVIETQAGEGNGG